MTGENATAWLQRAINAALAFDPEARRKLAPMAGRVIRIRLRLVERELFLFPGEDGIDISLDYDGEADTTLSGTPLALLKMGLSKQVATLLLKGDVSIEGDTRLGREFKKVLASIEIDWEEYAARLVGDIPAHHVFSTLHAIHRWGKKSLQSVVKDSSEYLQEESRDLVAAAELENFYQQVDELRDAVARIEKAIAHLKTSPTT